MKVVRCDVAIIGSGAGGGTAALALAPLVARGKRVLVLERGPRFRDGDFTGRELEMAGALYADEGGFLTRDGTMTLAFARGYGGSTLVYTGTSLVAPERVIRGWGVSGIEPDDLARRSRKYMEQNNVHLLEPALQNDNNRLFAAGAARAGFHPEQFPLNLRGCRGSSLCNLGCPNNAKQGTNRVQLPAAEREGVQVVTRAEVTRIEARRLHVLVSARPPGGKGEEPEWAPGEYLVEATQVVLAGGVMGTVPLLLWCWPAGSWERSRFCSAAGSPACPLAPEKDSPATPPISWSESIRRRSVTTWGTPRAGSWIAAAKTGSCSRPACTSPSLPPRT
jgi:choline dehydrogenase-like flavoprotein